LNPPPPPPRLAPFSYKSIFIPIGLFCFLCIPQFFTYRWSTETFPERKARSFLIYFSRQHPENKNHHNQKNNPNPHQNPKNKKKGFFFGGGVLLWGVSPGFFFLCGGGGGFFFFFFWSFVFPTCLSLTTSGSVLLQASLVSGLIRAFPPPKCSFSPLSLKLLSLFLSRL